MFSAGAAGLQRHLDEVGRTWIPVLTLGPIGCISLGKRHYLSEPIFLICKTKGSNTCSFSEGCGKGETWLSKSKTPVH